MVSAMLSYMAQILKHLGILIDGVNFTDVIPISVAHIYHVFDRSFTAAKLIMIKNIIYLIYFFIWIVIFIQ
jgi:hypothetical protein